MDVEKLQKILEKATPAQLAQHVVEFMKAAGSLANAGKHIADAIDTHSKLGDHMDAIGDHLDSMKECMGKAVAAGTLGKIEDENSLAKGMGTIFSGITASHGAMDKLIADTTEHLNNSQVSIEDASAAADEQTDNGLSAAERTEKRHKRDIAAIQKASDRKFKELQKSFMISQRSMEDGFNKMVNALTGPMVVPTHIEKTIPARTFVTLEKGADGTAAVPAVQVPGASPVAKISTGAQIEATDEYGMPTPEYLDAVEKGMLGRDGGTAFVKAAGVVPAQVGDPFPKNDTNLFRETHPASSVN